MAPMKMLWMRNIGVHCTGQVCARGLVGNGCRGHRVGQDRIVFGGKGRPDLTAEMVRGYVGFWSN